MVGESVTPNIGSITCARRGSSDRTFSKASAGSCACPTTASSAAVSSG